MLKSTRVFASLLACVLGTGYSANAAGGPVLINEFMAANEQFLSGPAGTSSTTGSSCIMRATRWWTSAGMYLTDDPEVPTKWKISASVPNLTRIAAQGYLIIWLDNDTEASGLHASFKLDVDE